MIDKYMPCTRDCPKRHIGCHSDCPDYIEWSQKRIERKRAERNQKEVQRNLDQYEVDRRKRLKKYWHRWER